jgi:hypothetical protein
MPKNSGFAGSIVGEYVTSPFERHAKRGEARLGIGYDSGELVE